MCSDNACQCFSRMALNKSILQITVITFICIKCRSSELSVSLLKAMGRQHGEAEGNKLGKGYYAFGCN